MENLVIDKDHNPSIIEGGIEWKEFFDKYWLKKPVLYKNPFRGPIMEKSLVLDVLKKYQLDLSNMIKRQIIIYNKNRVPLNGYHTSKRNNLGVHRLLPEASINNWDQYLKYLSSIEGYDEFCIYIEDANSDDQIWKITRDFLEKISPYNNFSPERVTCDFFIGNYSKTNFGVHIDPVDNMMFMLFGERTILLWSDDTWKNKLGNPNDNKHIELNYERFRSDAISYTLKAGDFLYWPSNHWHVGENNQLSASFNIDFSVTDHSVLADAIVKDTLGAALKKIGRELYQRDGHILEKHVGNKCEVILPESYTQHIQWIKAEVSGLNLFKELSSSWLKKNTSYGQLSAPTKRKEKILASTKLSRDQRFPILFTVIDETTLISHSGHILYILSNPQSVKHIIKLLNQESEFTAESLFEKLPGSNIDFPALISLLNELYSIHAIDKAY